METLFIGKNVIFLPETSSTNSYAIDLLKNVNLPEGTVVHTAHQTKGKGQRGSSWIADPASNLTASLVTKPAFLDLGKQFFLYIVAALAVYDTTSELCDNGQIDIKIKWPNDILANRQKIAGILIENNLTNGKIGWSVTGVGLNLNQSVFPDGMNATSVKKLTGGEHGVDNALQILCYHYEKFYLMLRQERYDLLREKYLGRLFGLYSEMDFTIGAVERTLRVEGIGDNGLLVLSDGNNCRMEYDVKEVKWHY